ncbi:hypothetical protein, partial [Vibrio alginolyticus]
MKKEKNIVKEALRLQLHFVNIAYEKYNTEVITAAKRCAPTTHSKDFDEAMRSIKARLSGRKAHAVKVARSLIIE